VIINAVKWAAPIRFPELIRGQITEPIIAFTPSGDFPVFIKKIKAIERLYV